MTAFDISLEVKAPSDLQDGLDVSLNSPANAFGVREIVSQLIIVPTGQPLGNFLPRHYSYEADFFSPSNLCELWFKVASNDLSLYVWSRFCPALVPSAVVSVSESASTSASSSSGTPEGRGIRLIREQTPGNVALSRGDSFRIRIRAVDEQMMPRKIFGHKNRLFDASTALEQEDYSFVASPFDPGIYPTDEADLTQSPSFFLTDVIDAIVPNEAAGIKLWEHVRREVDNLVASYNRHDTLESGDSHIVE